MTKYEIITKRHNVFTSVYFGNLTLAEAKKQLKKIAKKVDLPVDSSGLIVSDKVSSFHIIKERQ